MRCALVAAGAVVGLPLLIAPFFFACNAALGGVVEHDRLKLVSRSPNFYDGVFVNPRPITMWTGDSQGSSMWRFLTERRGRVPTGELPVVRRSAAELAEPPDGGLRATWLGHATVLVELEGRRILTDPVFAERCSPVGWAGPKRFHPVPVEVADLPPIDAVVISHDHYDHLDQASMVALDSRGTTFYVPLGVGAHLERWGVAAERIVELDWWQRAQVGEVTLVATPAQHFSGRGMLDRNRTLWASWAFLGSRQRVYFGGDGGMFDGFARIGERLGPFDLTILPIGAYDPAWAAVHLTPEEAVQAQRDLRGDVLLPSHWGTFNLALHPWIEPADRLLADGQARGVRLALPRPGESISAGQAAELPVAPWWRTVDGAPGAEEEVGG